jgi:uncharacterized protein (DUF1778 family)
MTILSPRDFRTVQQLIENPPPPNKALKRAFKSFKKYCPRNAAEIRARIKK